MSEPDPKTTLPRVPRILRQQLRTAEQARARAGVTQSTVSGWLAGKRRPLALLG
jgi:hypothetical protein